MSPSQAAQNAAAEIAIREVAKRDDRQNYDDGDYRASVTRTDFQWQVTVYRMPESVGSIVYVVVEDDGIVVNVSPGM